MPARLGQYQLLTELGRGGMGTVYRAMHTRLKRPVALKVLSIARMNDRRALARFQQEMEVVAPLDHPNIVRALDAGESDGWHFLVMPLVEGVDFGRLVRLRGPLPVAEASELIRQAALGLQHAHEHRLVHRDVKPSNLILDRSGVVKVLDLGIARLAEGGTDGETLTAPGEIVGTFEYMAPEQGADCRAVDIRADIYGLGCTFFRLLAGVPPFHAPEIDSKIKMLAAHAYAPVPSIRERRPDIPEGLATLLNRLLAKSPDDRPTTPAEVAEALTQYATGANLARLAASVPGEGPAEAGACGALPETLPNPDGSTALMGETPPETDGQFMRGPAAFEVVDLAIQGSKQQNGTALVEVVARAPWREPSGLWSGLRRFLLDRSWLAMMLIVALAMVLAAGVVMGTVLVLGNRADRPAEMRPDPEPIPGVPVPLLTRAPRALRWPDASPTSWTRIDPDRRKLFLHNEGFAFLKLGDSRKARRYTYEVTIGHVLWQNQSGIFLGWHETQVDGITVVRYQLIEVWRFRDLDGKDAYGISRSVENVRVPTTVTHAMALGASPTSIREPTPGEHRLSVTVGERGVESIRWDGVALPGLVGPQVDAKLSDADNRGGFGVVNMNSAAEFSEASFLLHREDGHDH